MSLHTLAKHVQEKGRGNDKMLVHMTPHEVQGLQALAKAHGGSLSVNPETGLPEAGFLEQVLPIVAMAAATYFTAGAAAPALTSALAAEGMAAGTAATVGGAMAGTAAGAGVGAIGSAMQGKDVGQGALYGGLGGAISGGMGAYGGTGDAATEAVKEAGQTAQVSNAVNQGTSINDAIKQAAADPNAGLAGTLPPTGTGLSYDPGAGYGAAQSGAPTPQQLADTKAFSGVGNTPAAPPSYYSTMGTPGKAMTLALPGLGADIGMNTPKPYNPAAVAPAGSEATISPDFQGYTPPQPDYYRAKYTRYAAQGGLMSLAPGGPVERMSQNVMGGSSNMYPQSQQEHTNFATPTQMPTSAEVIDSDYDTKTDPYTGVATANMAMGGLAALAEGGDPAKKKKQIADLTPESKLGGYDPYTASLAMLNNARHHASLTNAVPSMSAMNTLGGVPVAAGGGLASLGSYSDGGRLLKGPGDGMSDNIPAQIGAKQPARLADGEFVVPADVVSHLGNGSTDAGAKRLYAMMDKVRQARTGKKKQAPAVNTEKYLPRG